MAQYASQYYDPAKRHEYYMKHRKLKGRSSKRSSTAGLNDDGKAAASEVKERIKEERKGIYKLIAQALKDNVKKLKEQLKAEGLSKEEIADKVSELRENVKSYKEKIKEIFEEKYLSELDKIKQDPSMRK